MPSGWGLSRFFRSDHLIAGAGNGIPGPTDTWIMLAGLARETSTIRLGGLMTSATFRHPSVLSVTEAQVDQMSGGRGELGLGAGWWEREHAATGIELPDIHERFDRLAQQLEILDGLWNASAGEAYSFVGDAYRLDRATGFPRPVQDRVPIIIGGDGKTRTPGVGCALGEGVQLRLGDPAVTRFHFDRVAMACEHIGRDPLSLRRSTVQYLCAGDGVADRERRADRIGVPLSKLEGLIGDESDIRRRVADFQAAGAGRDDVEPVTTQ